MAYKSCLMWVLRNAASGETPFASGRAMATRVIVYEMLTIGSQFLKGPATVLGAQVGVVLRRGANVAVPENLAD